MFAEATASALHAVWQMLAQVMTILGWLWHQATLAGPLFTAMAACWAASQYGVGAATERRSREADRMSRIATTSKLLSELIIIADGQHEGQGAASQSAALTQIALLAELEPNVVEAARRGLNILAESPNYGNDDRIGPALNSALERVKRLP